jgi:hypothetical protein
LDISVLVYADENKLMRDNLHTVKRPTEVLFFARAEVDLDKILGKLHGMYRFMPREMNAGQIEN